MTDKEIMDLYESEWRKHSSFALGARRSLVDMQIHITRMALLEKGIVEGGVAQIRHSGFDTETFVFDCLKEYDRPRGRLVMYGCGILKSGKISNVKREVCYISEDDVDNGIPFVTKPVDQKTITTK